MSANFFESIKKSIANLKPSTIFIIVQGCTYLFFVPLCLLPYYYPQYFNWIVSTKAHVLVTGVFILLNTIAVLLSIIRKNSAYFSRFGPAWLIWYLFFIINTGGVNSTFTFGVLTIPIISISALNLRMTRAVCILSTILLSVVIFFDKNGFNPSNLVLHLLHILGFAILVFFIYKFSRNILLHKYNEEEAKRKFAELSEIDHVKNVFITATSHQLRTPLTATKWAIGSIIANKNKTDPRMLKISYDGVNKAIAIINDILKTAEFDIQAGPTKIEKIKISLAQIIKNVVLDLDYLKDSKNVKINYDKFEDVSTLGDEKMLSVAFSELIDNAIRFSPNGKVQIGLETERKKVRIKISDNGIGIDPADLEYVSQKFYRGKNALLIDPNQSGLGLYTAKRILELHDGNIKISSVLKKGTTVEITLPLI